MPAWYELAYLYDPGVCQWVSMPRPLYPPSDPDGPSKDGPDIEAVKRGIARLGRWPWPSDPGGAPFDQTYSDAFALGRSGNVGESGVMGFQRQADIAKPSGAIGERSYYALLAARIPAGQEHAGEFAFDARALELLRQAEKMFNKPNSTTPAQSPSVDRALEWMDHRIGWTEQPANSNCDNRPDGIRFAQDRCAGGGTWLRYEPWCGSVVFAALEHAGVKRLDSSLASVAAIEDAARAGTKCWRGWTTDRSKVQPGDVLVIGGYGVHTGMVRGFSGSNALTLEGNTSPGSSGSQSNGGGFYARTRYASEVRGYALVDYGA